MKTAMQELIDYLNKWDKEGEENFDALLCGTLVKAKLALEKEKEQIADAFRRGLRWVIKKISNMRNKLFYSLSVNILLVMLVVGLFIKGNFYLAVGLAVGSLIP